MTAGSCFLTGVQIHIDQGYVLNRRAARELLGKLEERAASLRRLIDQLSPLDEAVIDPLASPWQKKGAVRRKHRLICKAVADAIGPGYPEAKLFLQWTEYRANSQVVARRGIQQVAPTVRPDDMVMQDAEKTGRLVLDILDPERSLTADLRQAITFGACVKLRSQAPDAIAKQVRTVAMNGDDPTALGLTASDCVALRAYFCIRPC